MPPAPNIWSQHHVTHTSPPQLEHNPSIPSSSRPTIPATLTLRFHPLPIKLPRHPCLSSPRDVGKSISINVNVFDVHPPSTTFSFSSVNRCRHLMRNIHNRHSTFQDHHNLSIFIFTSVSPCFELRTLLTRNCLDLMHTAFPDTLIRQQSLILSTYIRTETGLLPLMEP